MIGSIASLLKPYIPESIFLFFFSSITKEGLIKYITNTGWMFFSRFALLGINFFVAVYLARYLGPSNYGLYNYVISFVGLFSFIAGFGIDAILGRELLLHEDKKEKYLGSALYIYVTSSVVALLCITAGAFFLEGNSFTTLLILLFSTTLFFQISGLLTTYFLSHVRAKLLAFLQITTAVVSVFFKGVGFFLEFSTTWFIFIFVIESCVYTVMAFYFFKKMDGKLSFAFDKKVFTNLIVSAFPFMLSIVATSLYMKIDQVMIKHMLGDVENGFYSVSVKLAEMWYFVPSIIVASVFPAIVNAKKVSEHMYYKRVRALIASLFILSFIFVLPLFFLAKSIITVLYGANYLQAIPSFMIYIWSTIPVFIMPALAAYVTTEDLGKKLLISTVVSACTNIVLNLLFIPKYGILGAAFATSIAYCIPALYLYLVFKKRWYTSHNNTLQ